MPRLVRRLLLPLLAALLLFSSGCSLTQKKISPRYTYRAGFLSSSDGKTFHTLLELLTEADKARSECLAVNRSMVTKAQYVVERRDSSIKVDVTECESAASGNCTHLKTCLAARPVAWLTRASGRTPELSGTVYTDWLGSCGGTIAVNFYLGPQTPLPLEKVGCAEPAHDRLDAAYDMFLAPKPGYQATGPAPHATSALDPSIAPSAPPPETLPTYTWQPDPVGPLIEGLLRKWDAIVFNSAEKSLGHL